MTSDHPVLPPAHALAESVVWRDPRTGRHGAIWRRHGRRNWVAHFDSKTIGEGSGKTLTKREAVEAVRRMMNAPSVEEVLQAHSGATTTAARSTW